MRLIDADAFDRYLASQEFHSAMLSCAEKSKPFQEKDMYYSSRSFRDVMALQPTIPTGDIAPRKHGFWENANYDEVGDSHAFQCSECCHRTWVRKGVHPPNFCSQCGAQMDLYL